MWWFSVVWAAIVPASQVTFDVAVSGTIAEIEVRQTFRNDSPYRVDATYRFPLHDDAVVDGMRIRLEDRTIEGRIEEKEAARRAYEEAVAQGKTAALTETERWNLYLQQVGNIPPSAELEVILRIVQPVDRLGRTFELSLPVGNAGSFDEEAPAVPADVTLEIDAGLPLANVDCVTHDAFEAPTGDGWTVLVSDADPERGAVVVRWELADPEAQIGAVYDERHVMLVFEPPVEAVARRPRQVVVVGEHRHADLMRQLATALQAQDPVQVLPSADVPAALRSLLDVASDGTRYVVVVSDGHWPDAEALIDQVARYEQPSPVFAVLPDGTANRFVLDELAERTGGRTFSAPLALDRVQQLLGRPTLADISIDWGDWGEAELAGGIRDVHLGDPVQVLARTRYADGGVIEVSGYVGDERRSFRVEPRAVAQGRALGSTWARARIETLGRRQVRTGTSARDEGLPLALSYGILSPWTAFVAIDPRVHQAPPPPPETDTVAADDDQGFEGDGFEEEEELALLEPEPEAVYKERTEIDFEGIDVSGELVKPDGGLYIRREVREKRVPPPPKAKAAKPAASGGAPLDGASVTQSSTSGFRYESRDHGPRTMSDGTVYYARSAPELRPMHPPPPRGALGLGGYVGTDVFGVRGGYDRAGLDDGVWRQVPVVLTLADRWASGDVGYRFQRLTAPDRTQPDRRRHAVHADVGGEGERGWYQVGGLAQELTCSRCDPARAMALDVEGGARFHDGPWHGRVGARLALSDFRAGDGLDQGLTAFAGAPVGVLAWAPDRFLARVELAPAVANPDGLRFVPTALAQVGPRFGRWHLRLGGGQRADTRRPVWGVPIERRGWLALGYGEGGPLATLRAGIDQSQGPLAPALEQLEVLPSAQWRRTALFGELVLAASRERWHLGWTTRLTHVLSTDASLGSPTAAYVPGLLLAHRPFVSRGEVGFSAQHTHLKLTGGVASPLPVDGWWGDWQAHGSLGAVQELGSAGRVGLGAVIEAWSGRPGDADPTRLDGWVAPERAGVWTGRLELSFRLI